MIGERWISKRSNLMFRFMVLCVCFISSSVVWLNLPEYAPQQVLVSKSGDVWFSSDSKLVDYSTKQSFSVGSKIYSLASDNQGRVWYGADQSIGYVSHEKLQLVGKGTYFHLTYNQGSIWFIHGLNQYGKVDALGSERIYNFPPGFSPTFLVGGPDGNLWVTDYKDKFIGRQTPGGLLVVYALNSSPADITSGPDGKLWFVTNAGVGNITLSGVIHTFDLGADYGSSSCHGNIIPGIGKDVVFALNGSLLAMDTQTFKHRIVASFQGGSRAFDCGNAALKSPGTYWFTDYVARQLGYISK